MGLVSLLHVVLVRVGLTNSIDISGTGLVEIQIIDSNSLGRGYGGLGVLS